MKPTRITYHRQSRELEVVFGEDACRIPAELLRVFSPSAEVRGHGPGQRRVQSGKKYVAITHIEAVGNYAVRLSFDDGHDSGIYGWDFLHELGTQAERYWQEYLRELDEANASRLPTIRVGNYTPPGKAPKP